MNKKEIREIGIIGHGHFGSFLEELSKKHFPKIKIKIFSRTNEFDGKRFFPLDEVSKSDLLFLAVPIKNLAETILKIEDLVSEKTIVVDISTVKEFPENQFKKNKKLKYICSHPMFGPFSYKKIGNKFDGLRVVLTGHNLEEDEYLFLKDLLVNKLKLKFIEMDSKSHDKLLAETLFLTHFIAQTIVRSGYERTQIDTVSFGFLMNAVESVKEDVELFKDVFRYNKYTVGVVKRFENSINKIKEELNEK